MIVTASLALVCIAAGLGGVLGLGAILVVRTNGAQLMQLSTELDSMNHDRCEAAEAMREERARRTLETRRSAYLLGAIRGLQLYATDHDIGRTELVVRIDDIMRACPVGAPSPEGRNND